MLSNSLKKRSVLSVQIDETPNGHVILVNWDAGILSHVLDLDTAFKKIEEIYKQEGSHEPYILYQEPWKEYDLWQEPWNEYDLWECLEYIVERLRQYGFPVEVTFIPDNPNDIERNERVEEHIRGIWIGNS